MKIPIILNNRNLLTWTSKMVEECKRFDNVGDIIIVDNDSTYEPLLEWYDTKPCEIIKTSNNGYLSPWVINLPEKLTSSFYVVSDPDLDLSNTPNDALTHLQDKMLKHSNYCRIGLSLENWNVSEKSPYHKFLNEWAKTNWDPNTISDGLLVNQQFDTTFGLYHINRNYRGSNCTTNSPYSVNHLPWEFTMDEINQLEIDNYEYYYYLKNSNSSSSYKKFINFH
jgi:hypothetical protein